MKQTLRAILLVCLIAVTVRAAEPAQLVAPDLHVRDISLQSLRAETISFFDSDRSYQREQISGFLQLRLTGAKPSRSEDGLLILTDGQRFRGRWLGGAREGQAIRWKHDLFGEMEFDLERVAGWQNGLDDDRVARGLDDRVLLVNGDVMHGFVVAVSGEGVSVQIQLEGAPQTLQLGIQQVRRVDLANPPEEVPVTGRIAYLVDGTQAHVAELTIEDTQVSLRRTADDEPMNIPLGALRRVDFPSDAVALRDLAALPYSLTGGGEVFGMGLVPQTDGSDVIMHAPMAAAFELPAGSQRFAAQAMLDVDPNDPVAWASFELIIRAGDRELARYPLSAEHQAVNINLSVVDAAALTIELDAGFNGPVMDRLRLRDAVVLFNW